MLSVLLFATLLFPHFRVPHVSLLTRGFQPTQQKSAPAKAAPTVPDDAPPPAKLNPEPLPPVAAGATVVASGPTALAQSSATDAASITPADRANLTITAWDLELLIRPTSSDLAVRAHITVRNDAAAARILLPLQISSTLQWQAITLNGKKLAFSVRPLDTDLDHTSIANEAAIHLPTPLAAGATLTLDALYEGTVPLDGSRIEHLGAPRDMAQRTDWDRIAGDFTGLRGFGTVLWYPVVADPVSLGDGAKIFHVIGEQKLREQSATMRIRLRVDTSTALDSPDANKHSSVQPRTTPRIAILDAEAFALQPGALAESDSELDAELSATPLGFAVPSIFLLSQNEVDAPGLRMFPRENNANAAPGFVTAAEQVRPLVQQWLGAQKRDLAIVDTPTLQDSAFETQPWPASPQGASVLVTPMLAQDPQQNTLAMAHALAHASLLSPRAWLAEGVAQFLSSLWIGNAQPGKAADPAASLGALEEQRPALALAETQDPGADAGQPLIAADDDIFLRTKSAYVLWMLREMTSDAALTDALQKYKAADDKQPEYFQHLLEAASHRDLQWFFDDWVYRDRGLPDLRIANVVSHKLDTTEPTWFVSADITNQGYASVEVPVTFHAGDRSETERLRVPARSSATAHAILHTQPTLVTANDGVTPEVGGSAHQYEIQAQRPSQ